MKQGKLFVLGIFAAALTFGLISTGCDNGTTSGTFVAVTGITDVPTAAIVNTPLSLSGTVEPSNAANKTIVWSGNGVNNGVLTATSAGTHTVTATIANGASESSPYTQNFSITAYDAGSGGGSNPFGNTTPFIWVMDNTGGSVWVTITDNSWAATVDGTAYNSGTYSRIGRTAAQWTVTGGSSTGNTGLAVIESGTMIVANFTNEYSQMNGTFTKLNPGQLTITNISQYNGKYAFAHTTNDDIEDGVVLLFAGKITVVYSEAVAITDGGVALPVYKVVNPETRAVLGYDESTTLNMDIVIMNSNVIPSTWTNHPSNWVANDEVSITFSSGIATLDGGNSSVIDWDGDD
jgi:hypothetical protein